MSYRPITDVWLLARSKVKYYGAYPAGFLDRARNLLGVGLADPVLHVCAGRIRDYPYEGLGPNDKTLDLDLALNPDFCMDAREPFPLANGKYSHQEGLCPWAAVLIDRPYSEEDAVHYGPGADKLPPLNLLLKHALDVIPIGGKVGVLDYKWPNPPFVGKGEDRLPIAKEVAAIAVGTGRNGNARWFTVWKKIR